MKKEKFLLNLYLLLIVIIFINMVVYFISRYFDLNPSILHYHRDDQFADSIKTSLSLKSLLSDSISRLDFQNWPKSFIHFYVNNPYQEFTSDHPVLSIFHHPPLTFNYFQAIAISMKYGIHPYVIIFVNFIVFSCLVFAIIYICKTEYHFSNSQTSLVTLIAFIGYPSLFAIDRGNFQSIFCSVFFIIGLLMAIRSQNKKISIILIALSLNIRPNILLALIPFVCIKTFKIDYLVKITIVSVIIYITCYVLANHLSPSYTFASFVEALKFYNEMYVIGSAGDAYNSSIHSFARVLSHFAGEYRVIVYSMSFVMAGVIVVTYIQFRNSVALVAYIGCALCMLFTPTFADYHLLIFLMPIVFAINEFDESPKVSYLVSISALAIMAPKFGILYSGFTLNSFLNPIICLITLLSILVLRVVSRTKFNSD